MAKLLCLLILGAACSLAQTVEGTVFDAATGSGVSGAKVELLKGGTAFYETTTDDRGYFRFDNLKEADYAARYRSPDYWLTAGSSDYRLFHVAAGNPVKLEARLMPWSRISGRVVDGRRNAVANARLELTGAGMLINGRTYLRTSWGGGGGAELREFPMDMNFTGTTDADGKFDVQVMPGSYGLSVIPPPALKPPDSEEDGTTRIWGRTYYPGVALAEGAAKLVVLPGGEVSGLELKLQAVPARAVRGIVLNPDGTPAAKVEIVSRQPFPSSSVESKLDGTFEFPNVAEGEWRLVAELKKGSVKLRATERVEVKSYDVENLKLRLAPPLSIRGRVELDSPNEKRELSLGPLVLSLAGGRDEPDLFMGGMVIQPYTDMAVENAYPGIYRLSPMFQQPTPPYYLDAVRVGETNLAMQDAEITSDVTIHVVYKHDGGSVRGKAEDCASGAVLLVPADPALRRKGYSKSGPCDSGGRYEVLAVRPGEYYALAFAGNGPVVAADETLLNQAVRITVRSGEVTTADLRTVTKPVL